MVPLIVGGAIAAIAPIIGDLIGRALSAGDREQADRYMQQALAQFGPDILKAPGVAELTPHLGPSAFEGMRADPGAVAAQREAMTEFGIRSKGDDLGFRAAVNQAEGHANQLARGQQGAISQAMAARGLGGSAADFAIRAQAGQEAANRASGMGFDAAMEGRRQANQALQNYGAIAGQVRGQDWGEKSDKARAADEIAKLNEMGRVNAVQQGFTNQMGLSTARANALGNAANVKNGQAAGTQQQWGNYGQAVGAGAGAIGQHITDERRREEDRAERLRLAQMKGDG
jgi:hypothetical protein